MGKLNFDVIEQGLLFQKGRELSSIDEQYIVFDGRVRPEANIPNIDEAQIQTHCLTPSRLIFCQVGAGHAVPTHRACQEVVL
jgi:hypothetical protein